MRNARVLNDLATSAEKADVALKAVQDQAARTATAMTAQEAPVRALASAYNDLASSAGKAAAAQKAAGAATEDSGTRARRAYGPWFSLFRLWGTRVSLFGGLATIGAVHLLVDGIAEILAVVIPATLALVAFGIAGADAAKLIFTHMQNLHTVMDATGRAIYPLTGAMEKLHQAVAPQVFQLFGDAITIMNSKTGEFRQIAMATGQVVDQLAARFTIAVTHGTAFNAFMGSAVSDVRLLGAFLGNLGGILGNVLRAVPGYAQALLSFGVALTGVLETVTRVAEPLIAFGLAVHGLFIWVGASITVVYLLVRGLLALGLAVRSLIIAAATNPFFWIVAAVGALAGLIFWLKSAKTATQDWADAVQQGIVNAPISQGVNAIVHGMDLISGAIDRATAKLATIPKYTMELGLHDTMVRRVSLAYQAQQAVVSQLQGAQGIAIDQAQLYTYRLNLLGKQFGGTQRAQELLVASGVTMNQMLTKTPGALLQIEQQVAGTNNAMRAMGQTSGTLGNDLVLMDKQATPAAAAMQKLNQAWDTFTSQMTGTQNAFDNVALGLRTLNSNATTASHSLGSAHLTIGALGTAMDGLTKNDLALNQAFEAQVSNTNALIDTWRTAGISSNVFTRGVKDAISTLVPFARGSKEATAQLVGLAQEAGFDGPVSMKALVKWLGNTHGALQAVKQITNQATIQEALLTSSMNAQGNLIASKLIGDINSAILAYNGVQKAAANYGKQVAEFGPQSTQAVNALKVLNDHIIASGVAAGDSTRQIAAMIAKVDKIPLSRAIKIVETGLGHFSISGVMASHALANAKLGPGQRPGGGLAAGGLVSHGTGPTSDDAPLLASRGEFVVKSAAVAKYGTHMMNLLNAGRFAAGGSVGSNPQLTGDVNVLTGAAPVNFDRMFVSQFTSSMERAMTASMRAAMAAATAAAARASVPGGATHGSLPYLERLWIAAGGPAGFAHLMAAIAMAESGGNANARNPSGASGLWQILGLPFPGNPFDPMTNARMAVSKFRSQGLGAWVTYTNGAYRQFFGGGGIIDEPIHGVGRSGRQYVFGERGPETVVPGKAAGRTGPLFTINGDLNIKDETDMAMVAQRLSFAVTAASLGS